MRAWRLSTAAAVFFVLGLAAGQAAGAASDRAVIRVVSVVASGNSIDRPPKGASPGDVILIVDRLSNDVRQFGKPKGAVVGADRAALTRERGGVTRVVGVAAFPDGQVRFRGRFRLQGKTAVVPIVGGTGRYQGARGTVTIVDIDERGGKALNVYRLVLVDKALQA